MLVAMMMVMMMMRWWGWWWWWLVDWLQLFFCIRTRNAPVFVLTHGVQMCEQIKKTQDEHQWIVAQRLLSSTYNT